MLDISFIKNEWENTTVFYPTNGIDWQTWNKPRGCKYIWIMVIGPGAGGFGGAGAGGAASAPGGGSGGVINALYPANVLPDTLYIRPGTGSLGATGSTVNANPVSSTAARSWVAVAPTTLGATPDSMFTVATSGTTGANGNVGDTGITLANFFSHACLLGLATFTGTNGQTGTNASDTTGITGTITCAGGRGSASSITAGSSIAAINFTAYTTPAINGGIAGSGKGDDGIWNWRPLYGLGGAGGGGAAGGVAGNGGDGAYGCGGGGGGNNSAGTGGNGGKGGDGLVIIVSL